MKETFKEKFLRGDKEILTILITSLFTIVFGVCTILKPEVKAFQVSLYLSLASILIQILIQQYFIREENSNIVHEKAKLIKNDTEKIAIDTGVLCGDTKHIKETTLDLNQKIKSWNSVLFPAEKCFEINDNVVKLFKNNTNSKMKMKIICYGTSKYGKLVDAIKFHKNTEFEIIVCSPHSPFLSNFQEDKKVLESVINDMVKDTRISLYVSTIPPTIRASLISKEVENNKENYVWCSVQPYYIFLEDEGKLFRGENFSPTIVADEESFVMSDLKKVFDDEFERLMKASTQVKTGERPQST
jgi:hypothetical protein